MSAIAANEAVLGQQALIDRLEGDTTLMDITNGVFPGHTGDENTPLPIIRVVLIDSDDLGTQNRTRVWTNLLFEILGFDDTHGGGPTFAPSDDLLTIANRIDALLHRQSWSGTGYLVHEAYRERAVVRPDVIQRRGYHWAGGEYVLRVQATA